MFEYFDNRTDGDFDLEIVQDNTFIRVRRDILAARSFIFQALISMDLHVQERNCLTIGGISAPAMRVVLDYIYSGRFPDSSTASWKIWVESAREIVNIAEEYDLQELKAFCDRNLGKICNISNVHEMRNIARRLDLPAASTAISGLMKRKLDDEEEEPTKQSGKALRMYL